METGDPIIDGVDQALAARRLPVLFSGEPLTADEIITVLSSLPAHVRARPVLLMAETSRMIVAVSPDAVLLTEVTPF